jgi:hypothetical protein
MNAKRREQLLGISGSKSQNMLQFRTLESKVSIEIDKVSNYIKNSET